MLANKVQRNIAVRVTPQPSLRSVVSRAVFIAAWQIPERHRHLLTVHPFPHVALPRITYSAHPVLGRCIATMATPQLPADESLQRRIGFVDQRAATGTAKRKGITEVQRLSIVEDVAFAVVRRRSAWWLVPEYWAPFDGQRLVGVDERLANGQRTGRVRLEVDRHEGAGHRRVAGQEKGLTLFEETGEAVADGICAKVGSVVADSHDYRCGRVVA